MTVGPGADPKVRLQSIFSAPGGSSSTTLKNYLFLNFRKGKVNLSYLVNVLDDLLYFVPAGALIAPSELVFGAAELCENILKTFIKLGITSSTSSESNSVFFCLTKHQDD